MVDYRILQQFVTFYHTGTLRETAEVLHISQPTLTRNMQRLEEEFEVSLFIRSRNSISLNETGLVAAEDAEKLLKQTEKMLCHVREFDRANRTVSIGACTPIPLPDIICRVTSVTPAAAISSETKNPLQLLEGLRDGSYQFILLPFCPEADDLYYKKWGEENLSFLLPKRHRFARRKSLNVSEMNGENMLLFQDIGFWHDLVVEKMPDSRFLLQTERYTFSELIENSVMPAFTTDLCRITPYVSQVMDRVAVPIADPEFHVTYYLACLKANREKLKALFNQAVDSVSSYDFL